MLIGRRNLSKEDRDELIRRLAASGKHTQKEIAETVGLERSVVSKIINKDVQNAHSPTIKSTSAAEELEAKRTNADKRRAVEMAFRWLIEEGRSLKSITDTEIAEMACVTNKTVGRIRVQIVENAETLMQTHKPQISQTDDSTTTQRLKDELASMQPVVRKRTPRFKASFNVSRET